MENNLLIKNINDLIVLLSVTKFLHRITLSYESREKPSQRTLNKCRCWNKNK